MMRVIKTWSSNELKLRYQRSFGMDISRFLKKEQIQLLEDEELGIQYFKGCDPGDDAFYALLSKQPWYYMVDKWEHRHALECLRKLGPQAAVLDVGCGSGEFLDLARNAGFSRVEGMEFNANALQLCRDKKLSVYSKSMADFISEGKKFDFISAFQVLEHVVNPEQFLKELSLLLNPNGVAVLSTPNRASFTKRIEWDLLDMPPHHLSRWDSDTFVKAGKKYDLSLTEVQIEPLATYHQAMYFSSFFEWIPNILKIRSILNKTVSFVKLPRAIRKEITGHTLMVVFHKAV